MTHAESVAAFLRSLQDRLCNELERVDGQARFTEDRWTRVVVRRFTSPTEPS